MLEPPFATDFSLVKFLPKAFQVLGLYLDPGNSFATAIGHSIRILWSHRTWRVKGALDDALAEVRWAISMKEHGITQRVRQLGFMEGFGPGPSAGSSSSGKLG